MPIATAMLWVMTLILDEAVDWFGRRQNSQDARQVNYIDALCGGICWIAIWSIILFSVLSKGRGIAWGGRPDSRWSAVEAYPAQTER